MICPSRTSSFLNSPRARCTTTPRMPPSRTSRFEPRPMTKSGISRSVQNRTSRAKPLPRKLDRAAELLKTNPDEVDEKLERLLATHKEMEKRIAELDRQTAESDAASLVKEAVDVDGTRLVVARRDLAVDALRALAQSLKSKLGSGVVVLGAAGDGRANLVGAVTEDLVARGISAARSACFRCTTLGRWCRGQARSRRFWWALRRASSGRDGCSG